MKIFSAFIFCFALLSAVSAQTFTISGRVIDADSRVALPFVNIVINDSNLGGTTDIDGKFGFRSDQEITFLKLSYVGYQSMTYYAENANKNIIIKLKKIEYELPEFVVYPAENPAHRIIRNAVANRDKNDPEKLPAFTYTAYDKMIFTLELDSLPLADTVKMDTTDEFRRFLDKHHLFMMESVAERKFKYPDKNEERVIATKVSGFKDPIFIFLISQWQSTSFYNNRIEIMGKPYVNPISKGSTDKYFFLLQDTLLYGENDSVFVISFRPRKNTNFDGLKGRISINTKNWAVQNVIAEPYGSNATLLFRIEQLYELIDGEHWFPVQINNQALMRSVSYNDTSLSIGLGSIPDSLADNVISIPFGIGKRYIRNINLNPDLRNREFGNTEVEVDPNANFRDDDFWAGYRVDTLTFKEENTYRYIDSLGKAENFDRIAKNFESVVTGKIPWGYVDLDINRFLRYNDFEGLAPGLGLHTNDRLSEVFHVGGFVRYGFRDDKVKFGGDADLLVVNRNDMHLGFSYQNDVSETGGVHFWDRQDKLIDEKYYRDFLVQKMDYIEQYTAYTNFRMLRYMNVHLGFSQTIKQVTDDYQYSINDNNLKILTNQFAFTDLVVGIRYAYKEKFIKNMRKKISLGTDYPILKFQYTRGLEGVLNGDFSYNRYDVNIEKSFYTNYLGKTSITLNAGYVDTDIPYTDLFNGNGAYRPFTIYAPVSFATMRMNEFLSNQYVALYFVHDFEKLLYKSRGFNPEFALATNIGFGTLDFKKSHNNIDFKTMEKGYYESGLLINNLLNLKIYSLGLGGFYRYGPYTFKKGWDNVGLKFTLKFAF